MASQDDTQSGSLATGSPGRSPLTTLNAHHSCPRSPAAQTPPELHVAYSRDPRLCWSRPLGRSLLLVGRGVGHDELHLEDPCLSRLHLRIKWDEDARTHRIEDRGSSNGTFRNGAPVRSALLAPGDIIRLGDTVMVYDAGGSTKRLHERVARGASSDLTVLILGETGAGKEVLARSIHGQSGRQGAFVAVNCGAFRGELVAAELFGHTKGAFSGAVTARPGLFATAKGGTLFLDELGELPLELQPALLRAVQHRCIRPVGGDAEVHVDVRVVAATNVDLKQAVADGSFREDLYARVAEIVFRVPPLRERKNEVLSLLIGFGDVAPEGIDADAVEALLLWDWPQNVRELRGLSRVYGALADTSERFDLAFLAEFAPEIAQPLALREQSAIALGEQRTTDISESVGPRVTLLHDVLGRSQGNVAAAARELNLSRMQLYRWMTQLGLSPEQFRESASIRTHLARKRTRRP